MKQGEQNLIKRSIYSLLQTWKFKQQIVLEDTAN